jgi:CubicO group peptidase (beta-lactamase class C family)
MTTQPVTSVALLMLSMRKATFSSTIRWHRYLPAFRDVRVFDGVDESGRMRLVAPARKVTILDVMTHTAGISRGAEPGPVDGAYRQAGIAEGQGSIGELAAKIAVMPLRTQPGTYWYYGLAHEIQANQFQTLVYQALVEAPAAEQGQHDKVAR